jgi:hypothetical protein
VSELFLPITPDETLERIQERLSQGATPAAVIEELLPRTRDEALSWCRRLAGCRRDTRSPIGRAWPSP